MNSLSSIKPYFISISKAFLLVFSLVFLVMEAIHSNSQSSHERGAKGKHLRILHFHSNSTGNSTLPQVVIVSRLLFTLAGIQTMAVLYSESLGCLFFYCIWGWGWGESRWWPHFVHLFPKFSMCSSFPENCP